MLDTTNLKKREPNPENINESLFNVVDALKEKRSQEDMLYEIMLKNSMYLTSPIETKTIDGKEVYIVAYGKLIVCLATDLSLTTIQSLIALEPADMKELGTRSTIILYDK
jgi:adenine-specific DNA-methyltransferase